jgi:O-acetyl-ADP-ribose deacetylase (regulator of RNase III)
MIEYSSTSVFNVSAQTIVNTVNCKGVMGAGLALEFKMRFPEMYADYIKRCERNEIQPGVLSIYRGYGRPWILNFPTKRHWKKPSQYQWIEMGLACFRDTYAQEGITSVAFPKLGSRNGKLDWNQVQAIMEHSLHDLPIRTVICLDQEDHPG